MIIQSLLAFALVTATAGQALTVTSSPGAPDPGPAAGQTVLVNFDTMTLPAGYTLTGGYNYQTGTTGGAAAPAGDTTQYLYVSSALSPNTATLTTAFDLKSISFYWGSIDKYNQVDVLGANGVTLGSFGGGMFPPSNGDQHGSSTNERVFFTTSAGEAITGLRFSSTGIAFELDNIAGTPTGDGNANGIVPEPASWALMIGGFAFVGLAARRRRGTMPSVTA